MRLQIIAAERLAAGSEIFLKAPDPIDFPEKWAFLLRDSKEKPF